MLEPFHPNLDACPCRPFEETEPQAQPEPSPSREGGFTGYGDDIDPEAECSEEEESDYERQLEEEEDYSGRRGGRQETWWGSCSCSDRGSFDEHGATGRHLLGRGHMYMTCEGGGTGRSALRTEPPYRA